MLFPMLHHLNLYLWDLFNRSAYVSIKKPFLLHVGPNMLRINFATYVIIVAILAINRMWLYLQRLPKTEPNFKSAFFKVHCLRFSFIYLIAHSFKSQKSKKHCISITDEPTSFKQVMQKFPLARGNRNRNSVIWAY